MFEETNFVKLFEGDQDFDAELFGWHRASQRASFMGKGDIDVMRTIKLDEVELAI